MTYWSLPFFVAMIIKDQVPRTCSRVLIFPAAIKNLFRTNKYSHSNNMIVFIRVNYQVSSNPSTRETRNIKIQGVDGFLLCKLWNYLLLKVIKRRKKKDI